MILSSTYDLRMCSPAFTQVELGTSVDLSVGKHAIFTVGVSASGKTTWADDVWAHSWNLGRIVRVICRDNIRTKLLPDFTWTEWNKHRGMEKDVTKIAKGKIEQAILAEYTIIISDTNLNPGRVEAMAKTFKDAGYQVWYKYFPVDWKTAVERDNARKNGVGVSVLAQQFERVHAATMPTVRLTGTYIIVDIDGTLAHADNRGIYDIDKVITDTPDPAIIVLVQAMSNLGYEIEVVSGRLRCSEADTKKWLDAYLDVPYRLSMRKDEDRRGDDIIKEEILYEVMSRHVNTYPLFWIDDRPRVTRMSRALGIKVLQVGNPYIEF